MKNLNVSISHPPERHKSKRLAVLRWEAVGQKGRLQHCLGTIWRYLEIVGVHLMTQLGHF